MGVRANTWPNYAQDCRCVRVVHARKYAFGAQSPNPAADSAADTLALMFDGAENEKQINATPPSPGWLLHCAYVFFLLLPMLAHAHTVTPDAHHRNKALGQQRHGDVAADAGCTVEWARPER